MKPNREAWIPYPVSDEIDDETGLPIQPQDERIVSETRNKINFILLT